MYIGQGPEIQCHPGLTSDERRRQVFDHNAPRWITKHKTHAQLNWPNEPRKPRGNLGKSSSKKVPHTVGTNSKKSNRSNRSSRSKTQNPDTDADADADADVAEPRNGERIKRPIVL